jgi:hypothetical protein
VGSGGGSGRRGLGVGVRRRVHGCLRRPTSGHWLGSSELK